MEHTLVNLKPHGYFPTDEGGDIYTSAVREWVAHQIRLRGHDHDRGQVRNVTFGWDTPYGSDVTPPGPKHTSLVCEICTSNAKNGAWWRDEEGWQRHEEEIDYVSPSQLVVECSLIADKLGWLAREGATDAKMRV